MSTSFLTARDISSFPYFLSLFFYFYSPFLSSFLLLCLFSLLQLCPSIIEVFFFISNSSCLLPYLLTPPSLSFSPSFFAFFILYFLSFLGSRLPSIVSFQTCAFFLLSFSCILFFLYFLPFFILCSPVFFLPFLFLSLFPSFLHSFFTSFLFLGSSFLLLSYF